GRTARNRGAHHLLRQPRPRPAGVLGALLHRIRPAGRRRRRPARPDQRGGTGEGARRHAGARRMAAAARADPHPAEHPLVRPRPGDRRGGGAPMSAVAVVSYASRIHPEGTADSEAGLVHSAVTEALARSGLARTDIGFTVSGSLDYLTGAPFSFVGALDALGAWPPISESHVEMDAAWALYEAWLRLRHDDVGAALVYGFGKA